MPSLPAVSHFFSFILILSFCAAANAEEKLIRAAGIDGSIVLCGAKAPEASVKRFVELAGGEKAKIVVLPAFGKNAPKERLDSVLKKFEGIKGYVESLHLESRKAADESKNVDRLKTATGVWVDGDDSAHFAAVYRDSNMEKELREMLNRGGVIGAQGPAAALLGSALADSDNNKGLDLLPDAVIEFAAEMKVAEERVLAALKKKPMLVGIALTEEGSLVVKGRDLRVLGAVGATVCIAPSSSRTKSTYGLTSKSPGDLTEFRRIARSRLQNPVYPPKELQDPNVPKGSLVIVGGGGMPAEITKKFIELAGGPESLIVVLPTAMPDPIKTNSEGGFLVRAGCKNVKTISARELKDVEDPKNLDILKEAKGLWFGGGRQWRFVDAYEGTKAHELFRQVLERGGVIGGSSAGATIQGDYLIRGAPEGAQIVMCEGYERALGFLPGVAIDQHFTQRKRLPDMSEFMRRYPQFLGIGLDEATALVVQGHVADVMGRGQAHFYDRKKPVKEGEADYEALKAGGRYNLKDRKILEAKK